MNTTPVIYLDEWVRREGRVSLVSFNNSQTQLRRNQGQASATHLALCSPDDWESCRGLWEGAAGCFDWCWLWCCEGSLVLLLFAHWAGAPEARRPGNNPPCSSLLNFSPMSITLSRSMKSQPCLWGMTSWSLVWFLLPALIEIYTSSLVWLSLAWPLDTDLSQWA